MKHDCNKAKKSFLIGSMLICTIVFIIFMGNTFPANTGQELVPDNKIANNRQDVNIDTILPELNNSNSEAAINRILLANISPYEKPELLLRIYEETTNYQVQRAILQYLTPLLYHDKQMLADFFWHITSGDDLTLAQEAAIALAKKNNQAALQFLTRHLDEHKLQSYPDGTYPKLDWSVSKQIVDKFPHSVTAQGIKAYEKITGQPFFDLEANRYLRNYGDQQYHPDQEIEGWLSWLTKFPGHIATDSAAYRLGRSYEIKGDYLHAVNWLNEAMYAPNGAISFDARGRLLYVLDVQMDLADLYQVQANEKLHPQLKPAILYTIAVKLARQGQYQEAIESFQAFTKEYANQPVYFFTDKYTVPEEAANNWDFWSKVNEQQAKLTELSAYSKQIDELNDAVESAPLQYEIAALIYHDPFIFYNHLWLGNRTNYNWVGHLNEILAQEKVTREMQSYLHEQNNYLQALHILERLAKLPVSPDLAEKVDYSIALAYAHLEQYGQEIAVLWPEDKQICLANQAFIAYLNKYPQGNYREPALRAVAAYGKLLARYTSP